MHNNCVYWADIINDSIGVSISIAWNVQICSGHICELLLP
jgi:hypothetical protein